MKRQYNLKYKFRITRIYMLCWYVCWYHMLIRVFVPYAMGRHCIVFAQKCLIIKQLGKTRKFWSETNKMQFESNDGDKHQLCQGLTLFKIYRGSVLIKSWSGILQMVSFYVSAITVKPFQPHFRIFTFCLIVLPIIFKFHHKTRDVCPMRLHMNNWRFPLGQSGRKHKPKFMQDMHE